MFDIENAVPFKNGIIIQGHFTVSKPQVVPSEILEVKDSSGSRIGLIRFVGIVSTKFSHDPSNPRYFISVAFEGDYRKLNGATVAKLTP